MRTTTATGVCIAAIALAVIAYLYSTSPVSTSMDTHSQSTTTEVTSRHTFVVGETARVGEFTLTLARVTSDSRCPENANCVWVGELITELVISYGTTTETVQLSTLGRPSTDDTDVNIDRYPSGGFAVRNSIIRITDVAPVRSTTATIPDAAYRITLTIEPSS